MSINDIGIISGLIATAATCHFVFLKSVIKNMMHEEFVSEKSLKNRLEKSKCLCELHIRHEGCGYTPIESPGSSDSKPPSGGSGIPYKK